MSLSFIDLLTYLVFGILGIIWVYAAVRMGARAVVRTLDERRKRNG